MAGLRQVTLEAGVTHAELARRGAGGRLEHRPRPAITRGGVAGPQVLCWRYLLPPVGSEAKRVDREMRAVCSAPEQRERESRTGLASPLAMLHKTTGPITGNNLGAPVDSQDWPKPAVACGHVRSAHERRASALGAAAMRK